MEIISTIFTEIGIKTIDGINIIEDSDGVLNLRSLKCYVYFSNNNTYDTLRSRCKSCQSLCIMMKIS